MAAVKANFRIESIDSAAVFILLEKKINSASQIESIQKAVTSEIDSGRQRLVFDFEGVEFVSSSMIGLLAEARQQLRTPQGVRPRHIDVYSDRSSAVAAVHEDDDSVQVALCSLAPQIEEVFRICGLIS